MGIFNEGEGRKAVTFGANGGPIDSRWRTGTILPQDNANGDPVAFIMVDQRDFAGEVQKWNDGTVKKQPMILLQTDEREDPDDDGVRGLYVKMSKKPGGMSFELDKAVAAAGAKRLEIGGTIAVRWVGEVPVGGGKTARTYEAAYKSPTSPYVAPRKDIFGGAPAASSAPAVDPWATTAGFTPAAAASSSAPADDMPPF